MREKVKGINEIGDALGMSEERKQDLEEIVLDRTVRGYSLREALERGIARKIKRKLLHENKN